jgi:tRNA pseudouridine55 synthase
VNGILNVNKPPGISSFGVVAKVRHTCGERRVGHGGTLDLEAAGVLPVFIGKATRAADYLLELCKIYRARVMLGVTTDTFDAAGAVTQTSDPSSITPDDVRQALLSFSGEIMQIPPMYSALKHQGQPLYKLAREGISVECDSRPVTVYRIELLDYCAPSFEIEVECSRGTYIRSLANDLGKLLGCGAHLNSLSRTKYGPFELADALPLDIIEASFKKNTWQGILHPIDSILQHLPAIIISEENEKIIRNGGAINKSEDLVSNGSELRYRAYDKNGVFFAIVRLDAETGLIKAEKVFV